MKYKIGDKLKVKKGCEKVCGTYHKYPLADHIVITDNTNGYIYEIFDKDKSILSSCNYCLRDEHLAHYTKDITDISTYEVGDILVDESAKERERKVLGILDLVVFMSFKNDFDMFASGYTVQEIESMGYKFKEQEPTKEPTELTLQDNVEAIIGFIESILESPPPYSADPTNPTKHWYQNEGHQKALDDIITNLKILKESI